MTDELIQKGDFARRLGVEPAAVSVWIARGKLDGEALTLEGLINVPIALAQLEQRLDPRRSLTDLGRIEADLATDVVRPSLADVQRRQQIEERELRLRRLREEEQARRGRYVLAENISRENGRRLSAVIMAMEQWLLHDMPDRIGLEREKIAVLRVEWRAFRQRQADQARTEAESLPEFVRDPEDEMAAVAAEAAE